MKHIALASLSLILVACTPQEQEQISEIMQGSSSASVMVSSAQAMSQTAEGQQMRSVSSVSAAQYQDFRAGVIGNGETSLLFFHAPWCPYCVKTNIQLSALYSDNSFSVSTYKVDYDSSIDLRQQYGVIVQDTVVLIDGNGKTIRSILHPTEADFLSLLK